MDCVPDRSTLGVVSFLNARPLISGLQGSETPESGEAFEGDANVRLRFAVPSALGRMLMRNEIRAGLIPVVDLADGKRAEGKRAEGKGFKIISDACIGSDGATMTVRVFSRVPPAEVRRLYVDGDSHTSVVLSRVLWRECYGIDLETVPLEDPLLLEECQAVMLIGDKVVTRSMDSFPCQLDLGEAWKSATGLPFVFAVWAGRCGDDLEELAVVLSAARDRGVSRAAEIAVTQGPALGWPKELAKTYLVDTLKFTLTDPFREGLRLFLDLAQRHGYLPAARSLVSP